ncbi:class III lanthionine synthetase LanKC [Streptomyces ureilyticus]|uniref:Phosphotransferase n=1 Tax=Streptomyces ureilyticus TaxID=1775131 RepID=A0ABX0DZC4_9ACTN|nr:class III lanthionine synthetase LanKC [Streptomyces ureilyticus]NGO46560.1 phosphotransferase [Streptomyces ureilyticus]
MYLTYLQYCLPGSPFYEQRDVEGQESHFSLHRAELPEGWVRDVRPEWIMYSRADLTMPWQGWKIHVTATAGNAEQLLDRVSQYCFERRVPFKALAGLSMLSQRNSKYADRGGSGKFITLYPPTNEALGTALRELDALIGGNEGPTILSDLRYHEGPLYVRYGAFVSRRITDESGRQIECVEDPDGKLVPDERRPGFHPPDWAELPEVLRESLRARDGRRLADFPYSVSRALHFSNGGGVYLAERQDSPGRKILLKEARPHCGLDESGRDAIARLDTERAALTDLAGLPGVPAVDAYVDGVEHKFLGREYIEGRSLIDLALERNPFISQDGSLSPETYAKWIADVIGQVTRTVARMHERGWIFGDLHPGNIVVDEAERVHFIDFESASQDLEGYRQTMGVFGYRAPTGYQGRAVDRYALGCMRIGLLLPMTRLLSLGAERATDLSRAAAERFGVGEEYFEGVAEQLAPSGEVSETGSGSAAGSAFRGVAAAADAGVPLPAEPVAAVAVSAPSAEDAFAVDHLAGALRAWRSPEREDRLYPGDIRQFLQPGGGLGLAYGATGVLWALHRCGGEVDPEDLDWLRRRVHTAEDIPVGFHCGLAGIAYAVQEWDPELAAYCQERAVRSAESVRDLSLGSGLSGLGAHLLDTGELAAAGRLAARLTDLLPPQQDRIAAGLVDGAAGIAVFALRAAVALGNPEYRRLAERLLDLEVTRFGFASGASPVTAAFPAFGTGIGSGALGLGLGLHDHVRLTGDHRFAEPLRRIITLAQRTTAAHNGLMNGRLGLIQMLLAIAPEEPASQAAVRRALEEAAWHTTPLGPHRIALGDEALKLSLDLGTGLAGLVVAAAAARDARCALPLWEGPR